jgi:hypothetical protein
LLPPTSRYPWYYRLQNAIVASANERRRRRKFAVSRMTIKETEKDEEKNDDDVEIEYVAETVGPPTKAWRMSCRSFNNEHLL